MAASFLLRLKSTIISVFFLVYQWKWNINKTTGGIRFYRQHSTQNVYTKEIVGPDKNTAHAYALEHTHEHSENTNTKTKFQCCVKSTYCCHLWSLFQQRIVGRESRRRIVSGARKCSSYLPWQRTRRLPGEGLG